MSKSIKIGTGLAAEGRGISIGGGEPLVVFAGPCVIESRDHALRHAEQIKTITDRLALPFVFKSSYDKANRTSKDSFRGVGLERGIEILSEIREQLKVPVITDIHSAEQALKVGVALDVLQIPAFLCRQTDLILAAAGTGKPLFVKKGQFVAPQDMKFVLEKAKSVNNDQVILCERGSSFGYRELIVDFRALTVMSQFGTPVVLDATHSVQVMGGASGVSSGNREFVSVLARAGVAVGVDGIFLECHENPDKAPSDGPNMLPMTALGPLLTDLKVLHELKLETRIRP